MKRILSRRAAHLLFAGSIFLALGLLVTAQETGKKDKDDLEEKKLPVVMVYILGEPPPGR